MKKCNNCQNEYECYGSRHKFCRDCKREYDRKYYANKSKEEKDKKVKLQYIRRNKNRLWVYNYLLENPCVVCDEKDPVVLDFDHIDKDQKEFCISDNMGMSLKRLQAEIAKCQVLCANCHRRRTAEQFGWYKFIDSV